MSSASPRSALSVSQPSSPQPHHNQPHHTESQPGAANPVRSIGVRSMGDHPVASPNGTPPPRRRRGRGRTQRGLVRPRCPEHGGEMLVGRTVGSVQYRYCTVDGCPCATTTFRSDAPHKRWPRPAHSHETARTRGRVDDPGQGILGPSSGERPTDVTILPQPSSVAPAERPAGRPLPGQSS
jgi:hypothetical protein